MIKLSPLSREPYWLDLAPGVRVRFKPITVAAMLVARERVGKVFADAAARGEADDGAVVGDVTIEAGIVMVRELARYGITEWDGVGDATGQPAPVTGETIDQLLDLWPIYRAVDQLYVGPAMVLDAEKNGSSSAPSGTSGTTAAPTARPAL